MTLPLATRCGLPCNTSMSRRLSGKGGGGECLQRLRDAMEPWLVLEDVELVHFQPELNNPLIALVGVIFVVGNERLSDDLRHLPLVFMGQLAGSA